MSNENQQRFGRYFAVRLISRLGDFVIYISLLWYFGMQSVVYAFLISMMFNYVVDFWGQKIWVFEDKSLGSAAWRLFGRYLAIRGSLAMVLGGSFWLLLKVVELSPIAVFLIVIVFVWPPIFWIYKKYLFKLGPHT